MYKQLLAVLLLSIMQLFALGMSVHAQQSPGLPMAFYGTTTINGKPAPTGTMIEAYTDQGTIRRGNITLTQPGSYGGPGGFDPKLVVQGNILTGETVNVMIIFKAGGLVADQSVQFTTGKITNLDLTFGIADVTNPVITILGDNPETVIFGSAYVDAGAMAVDDMDGDLTDSIRTLNYVNTDDNGMSVLLATVTYVVTDSSGNTASAQRYVYVKHRINVYPGNLVIDSGKTQKFTAEILDENGNAVQTPVAWISSDSDVGTIDDTGLFTASSGGLVVITASAGDVSGQAEVRVVAPILAQILVTPVSSTISVEQSLPLKAATLSQMFTPMEVEVMWKSNDTSVATIDEKGILKGISPGRAEINANSVNSLGDTITGFASVEVKPFVPVLSTISMFPATFPLVPSGNNVQFVAVSLNQQGKPLPVLLDWSVANPDVGNIDANGLFTALNSGVTEVTASYGSIKDTVSIEVAEGLSMVVSVKSSSVVKAGTAADFKLEAENKLASGDEIFFVQFIPDPELAVEPESLQGPSGWQMNYDAEFNRIDASCDVISNPQCAIKPGGKETFSFTATATEAAIGNSVGLFVYGDAINTETGAVSQDISVLPPFVDVVVLGNMPPVINPIPAQDISVGRALSLPIQATDAEGETLTFALGADAPDGVVIDPASGILSGQAPTVGTYNFKIQVSDSAFTAIERVELTVHANVPPVIVPIPALTVMAGNLVTFTASAIDADGDTPSYSLSENAPAGSAINPLTGAFSWTPMTKGGMHNFDVHVSDGVASVTSPVVIKVLFTPATSDDYPGKDDVWQKDNQAITLAPDCGLWGCNWTKYCLGDACDPSQGNDYTLPVIINTEGVAYFRYASQGNDGTTQPAVTRTVKVDRKSYTNNSVELKRGDPMPVRNDDNTIELKIISNTDQTIALSMRKLASAENTSTVGMPALGQYAEITAPAVEGIMTDSVIKMFYTDAEVSAAGIDESTLRLHYYNTTSSIWEKYDGNDGVAPDGGVDTTNNFVWAKTTHFSTWGIFGNSVPAPAPAPSGGGGSSPAIVNREGGGGGSATGRIISATPKKSPLVSTPTQKAEPIEAPEAEKQANGETAPSASARPITGMAVAGASKGRANPKAGAAIIIAIVAGGLLAAVIVKRFRKKAVK